MQRSPSFATARRLAAVAGILAVSLAATACSDDNDNGGAGPTTPRMFNQVQRLGNPLVSEVLLSKRSHSTHGSIGPDQDAALVAPEVVDFLTTVAGRDPAYINAIAPALIPGRAGGGHEQGPVDRLVALDDVVRGVGRPPPAGRRGGSRADGGVRQRARRSRPRNAAADHRQRGLRLAQRHHHVSLPRATELTSPNRRTPGVGPPVRRGERHFGMSERSWYALAAALALTGAAGIVRAAGPDAPPISSPSAAAAANIRDLDIAFYTARVSRDPRSARDFTQLAGLYLERARETADNADLARAEQNARHSLALRTGRNDRGVRRPGLEPPGPAPIRRSAARPAARCWPRTRRRLRRAGWWPRPSSSSDTTTEAGRLFGMLATYQGDLGVAPRLARWAELRGRPEEARRLLRQAPGRRRARRHGMPREQVAWFHLRLGDLALRAGQLDEARHELEAGLRILPADYRLLGALARLEAARHQWRRAADDGELAIAHALDPATLGLLYDSYAALGDTREGRRVLPRHGARGAAAAGAVPSRVEPLPARPRPRGAHGYSRTSRTELRTRRDIYGYDLLAWALHKSDRDAEARAPMRARPRLGTRDAMLYYPRRHDRARRWATPPAARASLETRAGDQPLRGIRRSPPRRGRCWTRSRAEADHVRAARPSCTSGFRHITDLDALDHILFLLRARGHLPRTRLAGPAVGVTAFTVGHSITLALAVTGALHLPTRADRVPDPGDDRRDRAGEHRGRAAASARRSGGGYRPVFAGVFGLVHGAGFANYLQSLFVGSIAVPLLGFNVGIELGQLVVLGLAGVALAGLRPRAGGSCATRRPCRRCIACGC